MSNVKQALLEIAGTISDDCTFEEAMDRLELRAKIERGEQDVEAGRLIDHAEALQRMKEWLESAGPKAH